MRYPHSRWRLHVGTLLLLLSNVLLQAKEEGTVSTDKLCYHFDEDIVITFHANDPGDDDWVGIYPFSTTDGDAEPSMWVSSARQV
jgi:hypothetical protein